MPCATRPYPAFEEIESYLQSLSHRETGRATLAVEGRSPQDRPVYSISLTDPDAPAEDKQNVLLSCVHSSERSAVAVLFAVMDWLLSSDSAAEEVMRRQRIICLPMVNPDGYVAGKLGLNQKARDGILYNGWDAKGVSKPGDAPEAVSLQRVIDRWQPDMYADVHGISLNCENQLMMESSASSPSRITNRPYRQQIARLMDQAALEGGFPSDFQEDDREVLFGDRSIDLIKTKLWPGRAGWSPGLYAYDRYHTLHVLMEITWQRSGLLRFQRLLRIGNEQWDGEPCPGYPNRVAFAAGMYQMIAAYGRNDGQRRASRVELWNRHH
ncbi:MAG: M14 family zinc carboxypeptidase, partial [Kiritimatiellia bacterium]